MPSLERNLERFEGYDAQVVGISIDHAYATAAWAETLGGISYPLLSDFFPHGEVAQKYGVLRKEGMAERATFVIDKQGIVQYGEVHPIGDVPDVEPIFAEFHRLP